MNILCVCFSCEISEWDWGVRWAIVCILKFLSSREDIGSLPGCRFLQNTAGCLPPAKWLIIMLMKSLFSGFESQIGCHSHFLLLFLWGQDSPSLLLFGANLVLCLAWAVWTWPQSVRGSNEHKHEYKHFIRTLSPFEASSLTVTLLCLLTFSCRYLKWSLVWSLFSHCK